MILCTSLAGHFCDALHTLAVSEMEIAIASTCLLMIQWLGERKIKQLLDGRQLLEHSLAGIFN